MPPPPPTRTRSVRTAAEACAGSSRLIPQPHILKMYGSVQVLGPVLHHWTYSICNRQLEQRNNFLRLQQSVLRLVQILDCIPTKFRRAQTCGTGGIAKRNSRV